MSDYLHHRPDCKFPSAPVYVCGCVKENMADRIEELETKLTKALRALERIELSTNTREQGAIAMATLAELTGGKDDNDYI